MTETYPIDGTGTDYLTIQKRLLRPFRLDELDFRAGGRGTALVYVELWNYFTRLDEDAPGQWEIGKPEAIQAAEFTNKDGEPVNLVSMLVSLTIAGHTVHGVSDLKTPTGAYAQAVKRAAAVHGLGRYLYAAPELRDAYKGYDLVVDKSVLIAKCYEAWGLELPEDFKVVESTPAPRTRSEDSAPKRQQPTSRSQSRGDDDQNPDMHKGKLTPKQCGKLYSIGITDDDISRMSTQDAREAVTAAFEGADVDEIRDRFVSAAPAAAGRRKW